MPTSSRLLDLPAEIHQLIAKYLDFRSLVRLKQSCWYLHALIPPLSHSQMLEVETSDFGQRKNLYACRDCLRLRPRAKFADKMVKKKKAKFAADADERFCVECGINPRQGTTRYSRGDHIVIQGELHVFCLACGAFDNGVLEGKRRLPKCQRCHRSSRAIELRNEERTARQERANLRAEQARRRARERELLGSELEDSEDEIPPQSYVE